MTKKSSLSASKSVECVPPDSRNRSRRVSFNAENRIQVIPTCKSRAKRRIAVAICIYFHRFNIFYLIGVLSFSAILSYRSIVRYNQLSGRLEGSALDELFSTNAPNTSSQLQTTGQRSRRLEDSLLVWPQLCVAIYCMHFAALVGFTLSCLLHTGNWPNDGFAPQFYASSSDVVNSNGKQLSFSQTAECARRRLRKARLRMRADELRAATQSPQLLCCVPPWNSIFHLCSALCLLAVSASSAGAASRLSRALTGGTLRCATN